jgi:filamentous hemagglutinin family protein
MRHDLNMAFHGSDGISARSGIHCLKSSKEAQQPAVVGEREQELLLGEMEPFILCRVCGNRITTLDAIIAVNGQHRHTCTNPAGITFEIGCFSSALGCLIYGIPTYEYTWFEGYTWSLTFCSRCTTHLGWYYQSGEDGFFGLILDRLRESAMTH